MSDDKARQLEIGFAAKAQLFFCPRPYNKRVYVFVYLAVCLRVCLSLSLFAPFLWSLYSTPQ